MARKSAASLFLGLVILVCGGAAAGAQVPAATPGSEVSNNVLFTVIDIAASAAGGIVDVPLLFRYERVLAPHWCLVVAPDVEVTWGASRAYLQLSPKAEMDWHPFDEGLSGFFVGATLFPSLGIVLSGAATGGATVGLGPTVGWQFALPGGINIDLALGIGA